MQHYPDVIQLDSTIFKAVFESDDKQMGITYARKLYINIVALFEMIVKRISLTILAISAVLALVHANIVVIQAFGYRANMTKAENSTNATKAKEGSLGTSESLTANKDQMQICRGSACHVVAGCIVCH